MKKYKGVVIPAVSPFTEDLKLDHKAVENIFKYFSVHKVSPFILGTTGEAPSISFEMKKEFIKLAGKLKTKEGFVYAGISSNVFSESTELANYAFDHGLDVTVATLPSYYALDESSMQRYFERLADAVHGPLMIYNIPSTTHMSIPLEIIDRLSHHDNIVGFKDSERSEERLMKSIQLWKERKDFSHFLGWAARSAPAIENGCDGLVPSTGNFHPQLYADLYEASVRKDQEKASALQRLSDVLGDLYQKGRTLGQSLWALKLIMKELKLCEAHVMPPIYQESMDKVEALRKEFHSIIEKEGIKI